MRLLSSAGLALAILATSAPAASAQSAAFVVRPAGNTGGRISMPYAPVVAGLVNGLIVMPMTYGGTLTVTLPPAVGQAIATAVKTPSPANGEAAGAAMAGALRAGGIPPAVVSSSAAAIAAYGSGAPTADRALTNAVQVMGAAQAAKQLDRLQGEALLTILLSVSQASAVARRERL